MEDKHRIAGLISAEIKADGAELCSLVDAQGRELLWDGAPPWPAHSPVLFPIVGQLAGDRLLVDGQSYPMARHGFARRRRFSWVTQNADSCQLALHDDDDTRAVFPFAFRLALTYRIEGAALSVEYALTNPGPDLLPASLGAHPAFRWPLRDGAQTDYRIEFADEETAPVHRLDAGLLCAAPQPSPVDGRVLRLDPALFQQDALIMLEPRSRSLRYVGPGGGIEFTWQGFPQLGLWQKPEAELLCIEPWHGYSSPAGWDGRISVTSPVSCTSHQAKPVCCAGAFARFQPKGGSGRPV